MEDINKLLFENVRENSLEGVKECIEKGADGHKTSGIAGEALITGHYEIFKYLIKNGAVINPMFAQFVAIKGDLEGMKLLVENGLDIKNNCRDAFISACSEGHIEIVRLFLEKEIDLNDEKNNGLFHAAIENRDDVLRLLIDHGADVNRNDTSALRWAAKYNCFQTVRTLLENGANVNAKVEIEPNSNALMFSPVFHQSALLNAYMKNNREIVQLLLIYGADHTELNLSDEEFFELFNRNEQLYNIFNRVRRRRI